MKIIPKLSLYPSLSGALIIISWWFGGVNSELQIGRENDDNLKIIFLISQRKHRL